MNKLYSDCSFHIVNYEAPKLMQEYLDRHEIERTLEQLSWYIASPDVKPLFTKAITNPSSESDFQKAMNVARMELIK